MTLSQIRVCLSTFAGQTSVTILIIGVLASLQKRKMRRTGHCKDSLSNYHQLVFFCISQVTTLVLQLSVKSIWCNNFFLIICVGSFSRIRPRLADPSFKPQKSHILAALENFSDVLRIQYSSPLFRLRTANAIQVRRRHMSCLDCFPNCE